MNYKLVFIVLAISVLIGGIFLYLNYKPVSYSESLECQRISYSGEPSEKMNIVFFTKGVSKDSLIDYVDYFNSFPPFSENKDKFNFFYLDYVPICKIDVGLLCYSRELIRVSSKCPNEIIVVLSDEKTNVRSSAYMNVISINSNLPKSVLIHELGHVFSNLADEYIPANIPSGSKNCVSECDGFDGIGGCFEGCSRSDFYRSSESSIMRTLSSDSFGDFNQNLIKQTITQY